MTAEVAQTGTILDQIVADTRELVAQRRGTEPLDVLRRRAESARLPAPFAPALTGGTLRVIAEVKKASPSRGLFDAEMDPVARARVYAEGGAAAISVLTEPKHFLGDVAFLGAIREGLERAGVGCPPLLRKDFLFDPYQVYEARAAGADAVLLIVAILSEGLLADLMALAADLGLGTLVEVHDEEEVERALRAGSCVVGINNRDLRTFHTDLAVTARLRPLIPTGTVVVSESGISSIADALSLREQGVDAVLVGESLMKAGDVSGAMRGLMV
ncbi:MAG: indole-3-glycerol phosphate synthase TrpC [Chloroflexi bacterium]|nr:indole-3-glycerol phosphate synthase TrpC [Chloroflexota bacterium]